MAYASTHEVERELPGGPGAFGINESDWDAALADYIADASETVDDLAGQTFDDADPPGVVTESVIRLVRSRLARIREDGLSSEQTAAGSQFSYTDPGRTRRDVKQQLREAGHVKSRRSTHVTTPGSDA